MAKQDVIDQLYADYHKFYSGYDSDAVSSYDLNIYKLINAQKLPEGSVIVDLGCGSGKKLKTLLPTTKSNLVGCDPLADVVLSSGRLSLVNDMMQEFLDAAESNSVDVIILNAVLEHLELEEVLNSLVACERVLKPGGILICKVPNGGSPFGGLYQYGDFTHKTIFNEISMRQISILAGFEVCESISERVSVGGGVKKIAISILNMFSTILNLGISYIVYKSRVVMTPNFVAVLHKSNL